MSISSLPEELNRWYETNCAKGDLAWSYLSKKSHVSVSQLCKIAKGTVSKPKFHTVKAILKALHPDDHAAVHKYLVENYPQHQVSLKVLADVKRLDIDDSSRQLLKDRMTFRIFKLAISEKYTPEQLKLEFGAEVVEPRLDALILAKIVEIDSSGCIRRTESHKETATSDFGDIADEFHHVVEILTSKKLISKISNREIDEIFNGLMFYHETFSPEAIQEMGQDIREFMDKMFKKYSQDRFRGDIPAFLNIASGRFDSK